MRARLSCTTITKNADGSATVTLAPTKGGPDIVWTSTVTMIVSHPQALKRFAVGQTYYVLFNLRPSAAAVATAKAIGKR